MKKSLLFLLFLSFTQVFFAQQNNTVFQYGNGYFGNPGSGNSLINLHPGSHFGITNITLTNITIPAGNNPITATAVLETTTGIRDSIAGTIIARENTSPTTAFFFQPNVGLSKTFAVPGVHTLNLVNSGTLTTTIIPAPTGSNSGTYTFSAIAVVKIGSTLTVAAGGSLSGNLGQIASELTSYQSTTPSIFTNTATSVTNTTAIWGGSSTAGSVTASGVIYSNIATQAAFTGNTANSGSSIQSMTYSGANAVFSATNSSLQPSTTYYYRAYVTVGGNVYQGILKSFTTCPTPVITGTQGICIGSTSSLSVNPTGGTWSSSNSSIATVNASGVVTGVSSGNATITYNYTGTGCTSSATIVITVTAPPSAGTLSGTQAICSNGSTTLSSTVSGGSWTSSNTAVATINSGSGVVSGVAAGTSTMTYTVLGTGGCANATATRDVTVTSAPNAGTVSGTQNICVGGSTTFTTTGTGGSWSSSNTNVATVNPSTGEISGVAAGTATITYTVTGTGGCTDATATRTVSVTAAPSAGTLSGTTSICSSGSTTLSSTVSGGTWSSGTTGVATVNSSTGVVSGVSAGTTTITYTVSGTGGCSNATATTDVTVSAGPNAGTISGTQNMCEGTSTLFTSTGTGGNWSAENPNIAEVAGDGTVFAVSSGTSDIYYVVLGTGSCVNDTATFSVVVTAAPSAGTISGTQTICSNGSTQLTVTGASGGTWSSDDTEVATVSSGGLVSGVIAGSANIVYTVLGTGGCSNATSSLSITVTQAPNAGTLSGTQDVCAGGTTTFTSTSSGGSWTSSNTAVATVNSSTGVISAITAGTSTITYTVLGTGVCANTTATRTVTVSAAPTAGTISGDGLICPGTTVLTLNGASAGTIAWSYSTTQNGTYTSLGSGSPYTTPSLNADTYYKATLTTANCGSVVTAPFLIDVVLGNLNTVVSVGAVSGPTSVTPGTTGLSYSVVPMEGAVTYVWQLPAGLAATTSTNNGANISVNVSGNYQGGTMTVYAEGCDNTQSLPTTITINTQGSAGFSITNSLGTNIICGGTSNVTFTAPVLANATYFWNLPAGVTLAGSSTGLSNSVVVNFASNYTGGSITCTRSTASGSSIGYYNVGGLASPATISGVTNLCGVSSPQVYTAATVAGASSYQWQLPTGVTGSSTTNTISLSWSGSISGFIHVRAVSSTCGSSNWTSLNIASLATPSEIAGPKVVCGATTYTIVGNDITATAQNTMTYSVANVSGLTYAWSLPTGMTGTSTTNSITVNVDPAIFISGNISVVATNASGCSSAARTLTIQKASIPISGPTSVCSYTSATYSVPSDAGTSFSWTLPSWMTLSSGSLTSNSITVDIPSEGASAQNLSVTVQTNCGPVTSSISVGCGVYTQLSPSSCGAQLTSVGATITCTPINAATGYRFEITPQGSGQTYTVESADQWIQLTEAVGMSLNYQTVHNIKVKAQINGVWRPLGANCSVTTPAIPTVTLTSCGSSLTSMGATLSAQGAHNVSMYEFEITAPGPTVYTVQSTDRFIQLQEALSPQYATTYGVRVRVQSNNTWGAFGNSCNVTTPTIPTVTLATCGLNLTSLGITVAAQGASNVSMYEFEITAPGPTVYTVESTDRFIQLQEALSPQYATTYGVRVRVQSNNTWGAYGNSCNVTTPSIPTVTLSTCGLNLTSLGGTVAAQGASNVSMYEFEITAPGPTVYTVQSTDRFIQLHEGLNNGVNLVPQNSTTYAVRVKIQSNGAWGAYGSSCNVTTPTSSALMAQGPQEYLSEEIGFVDEESIATIENTELVFSSWDALAYSNPFETAFKLSLMNAEGIQDNEQLAVVLSDLNGKVYSSTSLTKRELESADFGANVAAGLYIVTVQYNNESRTLRVLKK